MVDPRLKKFFSKKLNKIKVIGFNEQLNQIYYDFHFPLGSIAKYCIKTINDFESKNFNIDESIKWKFISTQRKLKCAISWKSINSSKGKHKSIKLSELSDVLRNPKIDFYNIQYTDEKTELDDLKKEHNITLKSPNGLDTFNDIEGLMNFIKSCDFVISVSNTNAHLSGILNKPTLLLSPKIHGTWYWLNEYENKNLWYPSVKVFSQKNLGDWSSVISNLNKYILEKI